MADVDNFKKEYDKILEQLSDPELSSNWQEFEKLSKKKKYLEKIIEKFKEVQDIKKQIEENKEIIKTESDAELISLAEAEINNLTKKQKLTEEELKNLRKEEEPKYQSVIVEIRAGTGGDEAALFAEDLFKMYSKYGEKQGWKLKILDSSPTGIGGLKEIIFELKNGDAYSKMRYEAGVHRVQRIPVTEKAGRIHTSTVSVAVLPKSEKSQIKINPKDLRIDVFCASGPGGQNVNKRKTAVRVVHLPSGLAVSSQISRTQQDNKEAALAILEARLLQKQQLLESESTAGKRKTQIGWAKRAEKMRTYNFPQDRITDHRVKKNWHNLQEILNGNLDQIINVLKKEAEKEE